MKILGSGKIDDFQKIVLGDKVVKALNVKPGDSILFYRGSGRQIQMQKAEGALLTTEVDKDDFRPDRNLRNARLLMIMGIVASMFILMMSTYSFRIGDSFEFDKDLIIYLVPSVFMIVVLGISYILIGRMANESLTGEGIISVGGPFSKNRVIGVSKVSSDGHIVTTNAYCYPIFGILPSSVTAEVTYRDGSRCMAPTLCTRDNPQLVVYKIRVPDGDLDTGTLKVTMRYVYSDKSIVADAVYHLSVAGRGNIRIESEEVTARLEFGKDFQKETFDEALFDPLDEPAF